MECVGTYDVEGDVLIVVRQRLPQARLVEVALFASLME